MKKILFLFLAISITSSLAVTKRNSSLPTESSSLSTLNNGLLAKYYFDNGNANDDLGVVHGTVYHASLTTDRFGCPNRAYHFDPADSSFIALGDNFDAAFTGPTGLFSISVWFKRKDLRHNNEFFIAKHGNSFCGEDGREFIFRIDEDDKLHFVYHTSLGIFTYRYAVGTTTILDTAWHHAVVNYNAAMNGNNGLDRVRLFLDGVPETMNMTGSYGILAPIQDGDGQLTIGACTGSVGDYCGPVPDTSYVFSGDLDDIRIYDRLLSNSEVFALYQETNSCSESSTNSIISTKKIFKLYPNPTNADLTIELLENITAESAIEIYNTQGQLVYHIEQLYGQKSMKVNVFDLPSGLYHVVLKDKNGILQSLQFVKN